MVKKSLSTPTHVCACGCELLGVNYNGIMLRRSTSCLKDCLRRGTPEGGCLTTKPLGEIRPLLFSTPLLRCKLNPRTKNPTCGVSTKGSRFKGLRPAVLLWAMGSINGIGHIQHRQFHPLYPGSKAQPRGGQVGKPIRIPAHIKAIGFSLGSSEGTT